MENKAIKKEIDVSYILSNLITSPIIRIDRNEFLRSALSNYFNDKIVDKAIEICPAYAGISTRRLRRISEEIIGLETTKTSAASFLAGLPGGAAILGTIPVDIAQFFVRILIVTQKLMYLYGWPDLLNENRELDDGTANILLQFTGIMFGADQSGKAVNILSNTLAKQFAKELAENAAEKGAQKITAQVVTKNAVKPVFNLTKKFILSEASKITLKKGAKVLVPILGGFVSGAITYFTFKPQARRLRNHLETLKQADPVFYAEARKNAAAYRSEVNCAEN